MRAPKWLRCLKAPSWAPLWARRALPGCWSQEDTERQRRTGQERYERIQALIEMEDSSDA